MKAADSDLFEGLGFQVTPGAEFRIQLNKRLSL